MTGHQLYSVFQGLALLTAILLRRPSTLPWRQRLGLWAGAIAGAGIGAKLPFVLLSGEGLFSAVWLLDGKTILAGLAGGYFGVEIAKRLMGVSAKTGDSFAVPLAAAVAVGRWGCYFNGCCAAPGIPVPIFESLFHASMAVILWRLESVAALRTQLLKLYLISYCVFRFVIEFVRVEPKVALGLTAYQYGAAGFAVVLGVLWWVDERRKRVPTVPDEVAVIPAQAEEA